MDWLTSSFASDARVSTVDAVLRLVAALLFGLSIAGVYRITRGPQVSRSSLIATLALLTVLIAMTTVVIGDNVARAFSVVGALSIVRFRTIVEDTRDTAFVILAVGVGLAVGAGFLIVPLIGLPISFAAAFFFHRLLDKGTVRPVPGFSARLRLVVDRDFTNNAAVREVLQRHAGRFTLHSTGIARERTESREEYLVADADESAMRGLVTELLGIAGVRAAEITRQE